MIGGILLKWKDIIPPFTTSPKSAVGISILLLLLGICSICSLIFTFRTIYPYLKSGKCPDTYHSKIFFFDVAEYSTGQVYLKAVQVQKEKELEYDIGLQVHLLAKGLVVKFSLLRIAVRFILFGQIPILFGVLFWFTCLHVCKI